MNHRAVRNIALSWCCTAVVACVPYGARPECPASGGPSWVRIDTEHFNLVTDHEREAAESIARELELGIDALAKVAFEHPRFSVEHTTVVVFRDSSEFHAFFPRSVQGMFVPRLRSDPELPRYLIARGRLTSDNRTIFFHELTHDIVHANFGAAPAWLEEGWAEYYASVRVENGRVVVGEPSRRITFTEDRVFERYSDVTGAGGVAIPIAEMPAASALVRMRRREFYGGPPSAPASGRALAAELDYDGAWALVHMLLDGPEAYQQRYRAFMKRAGTGENTEAAFQHAFQDVPAESFDRDFRRYLSKREIAISTTRYEPPSRPFEFSERKLSDAEVHLLWAKLTPWRGDEARVARSEIDAAVKAAPDSLEPIFYRGLFSAVQGDLNSAEYDIDAALDAAPNDSHYLLGLLGLKMLREQKHDVIHPSDVIDAAQRLKRVARTAIELNDTADALRSHGHAEEALDLAERAAKLSPFEPAVLNTLANVLFDLGRVEEAVDVQTAAVSFGDERTMNLGHEERLQRYRQELEKYRTAR